MQEVKIDNPKIDKKITYFLVFFFIVKIVMEIYFQPQNGAAEP